MVYCKNCGKKIPEDSEYCPVCGVKQMTLKTSKQDIIKGEIVKSKKFNLVNVLISMGWLLGLVIFFRLLFYAGSFISECILSQERATRLEQAYSQCVLSGGSFDLTAYLPFIKDLGFYDLIFIALIIFIISAVISGIYFFILKKDLNFRKNIIISITLFVILNIAQVLGIIILYGLLK